MSGTLDLRKLCPPARWWRRQDDTVAIPITIRDSTIGTLEGITLIVTAPIVLDHVVVQGALALHSCFFVGGLQARDCTFNGEVDLCWGGHNGLDHPFVRGTNLLGMKGWPNHVTFDMPPVVERNAGRLDADGTADPGAPA